MGASATLTTLIFVGALLCCLIPLGIIMAVLLWWLSQREQKEAPPFAEPPSPPLAPAEFEEPETSPGVATGEAAPPPTAAEPAARKKAEVPVKETAQAEIEPPGPDEAATRAMEVAAAPPEAKTELMAKPGPAEPPKPDDLTRIKGIGPKISEVLAAAGISSFARLAASAPEEVKAVLLDAEVRLTNYDTWPRQAKLAAVGKWDELRKLKEAM
jgi:predicted flap endonuclease-1-like 5' DNA nuclease